MVRRKKKDFKKERGFISFKKKGEFKYRGISAEALEKMSIDEFKKLIPSRQKRSLNRGFTKMQETLLTKIRKTEKAEEDGKRQKLIKTHVRDLVILPEMIGYTINVYNGKTFVPVTVKPQMVSHYLGEFSHTRVPIKHGSPGIGASRSSMAVGSKK
ncbi:MAG: 30S ribosomal protein S19 [Nanoarchaeota archaeon]|nr:30S ribosomal protein S19 [Nanoarchaeota archaeon]